MTRGSFSRPGEYSDDGLYWRDAKAGTLYHVHATATEACEVRGTNLGVRWCRSVVSQLRRGPAIIGWRFDAVIDGAAHVAAAVRFWRHARRGLHDLDDLSRGFPAREYWDTSQPVARAADPQRAAAALARLHEKLRACGWEQHGQSDAHWYSRRYRRPVILWDQPVHATEIRQRR
jgi:hypothetical protein